VRTASFKTEALALSQLVKTRGLVLARLDFGNTSRIFTFLTPGRGRVSALAKGARRPRGGAGLGGGLDLLSENEILYYERRAGMAILAEWSELDEPGRCAPLRRNAVRFAAAELLAELGRECSQEGEGQPELYALLAEGTGLAAGAERLVPATLAVALGMLSAAGFRPVAERCAACGRKPAGGVWKTRAFLSAEEGGVVCGPCAARGAEGAADRGAWLSVEAGALLGALLRLKPAAAARLRPSRKAERELLGAFDRFASWKLERRLRGVRGLSEVIAGLEAAGCR
jgi:DNA repair protein RecO (recombination protein O)